MANGVMIIIYVLTSGMSIFDLYKNPLNLQLCAFVLLNFFSEFIPSSLERNSNANILITLDCTMNLLTSI